MMTGYEIWLRQVRQVVLDRTSLLCLRRLWLEGEMKTGALGLVIAQFSTLYECITRLRLIAQHVVCATRGIRTPTGSTWLSTVFKQFSGEVLILQDGPAR